MKIFYKIKYLFQKLFRGFSDDELWNLDDTIMEFVLPRLKAFRKMEKDGYPYNLSENKWNKILEKMIWSLENYDDLIVLKELSEKEWEKRKKEIEEKYKDDEHMKKFQLWFSKSVIDRVKTERNQKRFDEGWNLFHKYFFNLWD